MIRPILGFLLITSASHAAAQGFEQCDATLVKETYRLNESFSSDYRMAQFVDEATYNQAKSDASGNAVIYGVPVGANYSEYKQNAAQKASGVNESLSKKSARSLLWNGLSSAGAAAYSKCLEAVAESDQLITAIGNATDKYVSLRLKWKKSAFGPETVSLRWQASPKGNVSQLPTRISVAPGWMSVQIRRPTDVPETLLTINASAGGKNVDSSEIVISRYVPPVVTKREPVVINLSGTSIIMHDFPADAGGVVATISATASSRQLRPEPLATLRIEAAVLTESGWSQVCGSPTVRGDGLLQLPMACQFPVPMGAQKLRIQAFDTDAKAEEITAKIRY